MLGMFSPCSESKVSETEDDINYSVYEHDLEDQIWRAVYLINCKKMSHFTFEYV